MASSSSLSHSWLYHVFLSFLGEDVRKGFLSHVRKGLESKGIIAFVDEEIKRGKSVGPVLVGAIRQSRVSVVLLSPNYASSNWCLDELVEIMKCREEYQQTVMTIFYEVDPSDVRKQTGDFGKAFDATCVGKIEEVKQAWRQALTDVAGGYHTSNYDNEAEMINKIASDVTAVLGFTPSKDFDDFIGIGARIIEIKSKLILQSEEVKVIGVVGPPGIGSYEKPCGNDYQVKLCLQKKLLSQIFNQRDIEVRHLGVAQEMMMGSWWQLAATADQRGWLGPGSIIIITTEDKKLLKALGLGINHIYEMEFPTSSESLQIFCQYAFGQTSPYYGFESLAWEVTSLSGDLPLGLRVMGSYLRGMSRDYWIDALPRLRFSYDVLSDKDKALFLHIACFFVGFGEDFIKRCLEKRGLDVNHGLQVLANKSLISIENRYVKMHCLLQQMGREIVKKESLEEPGHRQFLMDTMEISDVLEEDTGTGKVLGIKLDTLKNKKIQITSPLPQADGFELLQVSEKDSRSLKSNYLLELTSSIGNATKLTIFNLRGCSLLKELSSSIGSTWSWLYRLDITGCTNIKDFPDVPDSIVELVLYCTGIEEVPPLIGNLFRLRKLFMYGCKKLKTISPNISKLENLELLALCNRGEIEHDYERLHLFNYHNLFQAVINWRGDLKRSWELRSDFKVHYIFPICLPEKALSSPVSLRLAGDSVETIPDCIISLSGLIKLNVIACKKLVALPQLPGEKVPTHFTHRASSGSLTINLTPTPLPSYFRFKSCILLSEGQAVNNSLMDVSFRGRTVKLWLIINGTPILNSKSSRTFFTSHNGTHRVLALPFSFGLPS
ncbi:hypothetical protein Bca52824_046627 [Brassica carinata]|uniref:TIR domain-containing protein n=1 Tax=Brassica carinata TaxID=52824 RepID=A0A8X7RFN2_BRACI|nr:hypothetical protein Bca52824_046627 [Brassica carinata]